MTEDDATAAFTLLLPGKTLYLSKLLYLNKFRNKWNKDGSVRAFYKLEEQELGKFLEVVGGKGSSTVSLYIRNTCMCFALVVIKLFMNYQQYEFVKTEVPEDVEERKKLAKKLQKYISLTQYVHTINQKEIRP